MKFFVLLMAFVVAAQLMALPLQGLKNMDGAEAKLSHEKNTELVVFWATWCPDCKAHLTKELPVLNKEKNVAVITINTDRSEGRARAYVEKTNLKLPVFRDPTRNLRKSLKVFSVPHWAVYKRADQKSQWKLVDAAPAFEWERINKALKRNHG